MGTFFIFHLCSSASERWAFPVFNGTWVGKAERSNVKMYDSKSIWQYGNVERRRAGVLHQSSTAAPPPSGAASHSPLLLGGKLSWSPELDFISQKNSMQHVRIFTITAMKWMDVNSLEKTHIDVNQQSMRHRFSFMSPDVIDLTTVFSSCTYASTLIKRSAYRCGNNPLSQNHDTYLSCWSQNGREPLQLHRGNVGDNLKEKKFDTLSVGWTIAIIPAGYRWWDVVILQVCRSPSLRNHFQLERKFCIGWQSGTGVAVEFLFNQQSVDSRAKVYKQCAGTGVCVCLSSGCCKNVSSIDLWALYADCRGHWSNGFGMSRSKRFTATEVLQARDRLYFGDQNDDRCFMAGWHDDAPTLERIGEICRETWEPFGRVELVKLNRLQSASHLIRECTGGLLRGGNGVSQGGEGQSWGGVRPGRDEGEGRVSQGVTERLMHTPFKREQTLLKTIFLHHNTQKKQNNFLLMPTAHW